MEIRETGDVKTIKYKGGDLQRDVLLIPLKMLTYNKYNGRIKSVVRSYENGFGRELDPNAPDDINLIESFLYDSAENRNEKTIKSLKDYGQQEIGIVTEDMIIIDGNRRASLLNKIARESGEELYFKAIILPDELGENPLEIIKLETNYQMGVDNKVEYKPIEKYLRCKELVYDHGVSKTDVAKLMSETVGRIDQWLEILALMEEYLVYLGSPAVYTRLDRTEGHFVDLYNYIKKYRNQGVTNIDELKTVYFDYIRLGLPVQRIRVLGNPNNSMSLFARNEHWNEFYSRHMEIKRDYVEEDFGTLKEKHKGRSNEETFLFQDRSFKDKLEEDLKENLISGEIEIKNIAEKNSIRKELSRMKNFLTRFRIPEDQAERELSKTLVEDIATLATDLKDRL